MGSSRSSKFSPLNAGTESTAEGAFASGATISHPATATVPTDRVGLRERLAYGVGDVGGNLIFAPIAAFLLFYLTDIAGIGAAIAGTLLLIGRVLDGTLDLIIGTLIDRTKSRWGKARPWILFATPVVVITFILLFNVPADLSTTGKEIYAFVFYFLCLGVGFVSSNLAYHTLLSVITSDAKSRVSLTIIRTFFAMITSILVNVITLPMITALGGGQSAWSTMALTYGLVAAATFLVLFFGTRERIQQPPKPRELGGPSLVARIAILFRNRYFFLAFVFFLVLYMTSSLSAVGVYFAEDVIGDANAYSLISLVGSVPLLIGIWFMGPLISKFGKRGPVLIGIALILIGSGIPLADPSNLNLVLLGALVRGIGMLPASAAMFAVVADVVDYGEWKSGVRLDGMTFAAATAGQNFGAGLGVALVGWMLAASGYDGRAEVQIDSALSMEVFLVFIAPMIGATLLGIVMFFLDLDKTLPRIQKDLAERRASSEQVSA